MSDEYGSADETTYNGIWRRVFDDCVTFQPDYLKGDGVDCWDYTVAKFPLVPGFHVCFLPDPHGDEETCEIVLSTHKTLHEAMNILKVLLANGGVKYD